jgi:hypothetical protein
MQTPTLTGGQPMAIRFAGIWQYRPSAGRAAVALLAAALLAGCSMSTPAPAPAVAQVVVGAPLDSVWPRVIAFFANNNVPVQTLEKASGLIASQPLDLSSEQRRAWLACGKALGVTIKPERDGFHARTTFNVFVRPIADSTSVRVNMAVHATMDSYTGGESELDCQSNGKFEQALLATL